MAGCSPARLDTPAPRRDNCCIPDPSRLLSEPAGTAGRPTAPAPFDTLLPGVVDAAFGAGLCLTGSRAGAEELVHDAAVLAYGRYPGLAPGTNFRAWYFRILVNSWRAGREPALPESGTPDWEDTPDLYLFARSIEHGLPYDGPDPAQELFERLGAPRVSEAIARLPDAYRVAAALEFSGRFAIGDIAWILELPAGAARARLYRARKMLQQSLWRVAVENGLAPGGAA